MPFFPTCQIALQGQNGMEIYSILPLQGRMDWTCHSILPISCAISPARYFPAQNMRCFVFVMGKYIAFYIILITELVTVPNVVVVIVVVQICYILQHS